MPRLPRRQAGAAWLVIAATGCSSDDPKPNESNSQPGGSTTGGSNVSATGGSTAGGSASATGGTISNAGSLSTGGAPNVGGARSGGSAGTAGASGNKGTGGTPSAGGAGTGGGGAGSTHTGPWNVMMLGDSITASTCYPQLLSQQFKSGGHTNFEFVGSQTTNQSCNGAPAVETEGHGGYGVTYLPENSTRAACTKPTGCGSYAELTTWSMSKPDVVLMHYGTNDVWDGQSASDILSAYVAVITEFRKQNQNAIFFVSKIIKLNPSGCADCSSNVQALANAVTDGWATMNSTATSPVHIVNAYDSGFDPNDAADAADGVHPTLAGAAKLATATYTDVVARGYF